MVTRRHLTVECVSATPSTERPGFVAYELRVGTFGVVKTLYARVNRYEPGRSYTIYTPATINEIINGG